MFTSLRLRVFEERLQQAFDAWRATPLPKDGFDPSTPAPGPDVLTADQFAGLAGVSEKLAKAFLERKAAEFGIEGDWIYFQGGPFWIEYRFPKVTEP